MPSRSVARMLAPYVGAMSRCLSKAERGVFFKIKIIIYEGGQVKLLAGFVQNVTVNKINSPERAEDKAEIDRVMSPARGVAARGVVDAIAVRPNPRNPRRGVSAVQQRLEES